MDSQTQRQMYAVALLMYGIFKKNIGVAKKVLQILVKMMKSKVRFLEIHWSGSDVIYVFCRHNWLLSLSILCFWSLAAYSTTFRNLSSVRSPISTHTKVCHWQTSNSWHPTKCEKWPMVKILLPKEFEILRAVIMNIISSTERIQRQRISSKIRK